MLGESTACQPAKEEAQGLRRVVDADRGAAGRSRREARYQRGQQGLEDVESDEEGEDGERVREDAGGEWQEKLYRDQQRDGANEHGLWLVATVGVQDRRHHERKRG